MQGNPGQAGRLLLGGAWNGRDEGIIVQTNIGLGTKIYLAHLEKKSYFLLFITLVTL